jgi:hypothetical protein
MMLALFLQLKIDLRFFAASLIAFSALKDFLPNKKGKCCAVLIDFTSRAFIDFSYLNTSLMQPKDE